LEYGTDASRCTRFELSENGMCFASRWGFALGMQLGVVLVADGAGARAGRVAVEGVVVGCEEEGAGIERTYRTTLFFPECPEAVRAFLPQ